MSNRIPIMLLWIVGFLTVALTIHSPWLVDTTLVFGAIMGTRKAWRPALRFLISLALIAVVVLFSPSTTSILLQTTMALIALGEARASRVAPNRTIIGALVLVTIATFIHAAAAFGFIPVGIIGILSLLTGDEVDSSLQRDRTRLGFTLALIASVGAIIMALILSIFPWQTVIADVFSVIAYPLIALLSRISLGNLRTRKTQSTPTPISKTQHALSQHSHLPTALSTSFIILGILVLAAILYGAYRYWSKADTRIGDSDDHDVILREALAPNERSQPWRRRNRPLGPVRSLIRTRLIQARRRRQERASGETLREWVMRIRPNHDNELIITTYNQIRYGESADTREARERIEAQWPQS